MCKDNYLLQMSLLYIEDDVQTREEMRMFLKRRVGKVITAQDGLDGLKKFEENQPDIVIADILMPKLDGIGMLRKIRQDGYSTPFVITSTANDSQTILETVDLGIVKYIVKPIQLKELENCLLQLARDHHQSNFNLEDLGLEEKKQLEFSIKKEVSVFLKTSAGKGPRDVSAFIHRNLIDVIAYDTLTPMEQINLRYKENENLVKNNRQIFYEAISSDLEQIVASVVRFPVRLQKVDINLGKNDKMVFELLQDGGFR